MTSPPIIIVRNGRESSILRLEAGDRIASKHFDPARGVLIFEVATDGVPESCEVREWQSESTDDARSA